MYLFNLEDKWCFVLYMLLNQDFEDFLALDIGLDGARSSQLFESGFTRFRGFFSVGHWLSWCALQPVI
jgi:hypothetical protein